MAVLTTNTSCKVTKVLEEDGVKVEVVNTDGVNRWIIYNPNSFIFSIIDMSDEQLDTLLKLIGELRAEDCNGRPA